VLTTGSAAQASPTAARDSALKDAVEKAFAGKHTKTDGKLIKRYPEIAAALPDSARVNIEVYDGDGTATVVQGSDLTRALMVCYWYNGSIRYCTSLTN
jgi:hypothetical protein